MTLEYGLSVVAGIVLAFAVRSVLKDARVERERDEMRKHIRRTCQ